MTTPVTENTAYSIITDGLRNAKKLPFGEDPDSEELGLYMRKLNQIINFVQTTGIRLFLIQDTPITLVAGTSLYTLGPSGTVVMTKPIGVVDQYYLYSAANGATKRPVFKISRQEWDMLSVTTQQGPVTQIFVDPQVLTLNINTWLVPDANEATGTLHLALKTQVTNFVGVTDSMQFPIEWALTLGWLFAKEVAIGQPQAIVTRCDQMADYYLMKLDEWDAEQDTSIFPQPDQRLFQNRRFNR